MGNRLVIRGGRVIDPAHGIDRVTDVLVSEGRIESVSERPLESVPEDCRIVEARGLVVSPGFVDLHAHFRDPGQEHKETLATGARAAARGGFTTVVTMANTVPPVDSAGAVRDLLERARSEAVVRILPAGTVTLGRRGKTLAPLGEMAGAGAVAFSDDGDMVADSNLMRQAVAYCTALGVPIMDHPEDPSLVAAGVINDGPVAARLGLAGRPASAEAVAVARDISLAEATGGWIHLQHVSTRGAADLLRQARARGVRVTAEATPHHLTMTDAWAYGEAGEEPAALGLHAYDTNTRVNPPLRSADDVSAVVEALADGTIDVVATDHAPHAPSEKRTTYDDAPAGMNVLETAFAQVNTLARQGKIGLSALIGRLSARPAALLGMELGALRPGWPADIVLLDPEGEWVVDASRFASRSRNTPLQGRRVTGKVKMTIFRGEVVHDLTREGEAVGG